MKSTLEPTTKGPAMDSLLEELNKHLTPSAISQLSGAIGTDPQQTTTAISAALPMIVGGLSRNTLKDPHGAQALNDALQKDHDGGVLDSLDAMFGGASRGGGAGAGAAGGILGGILGSVLGGAGRGGDVARSARGDGSGLGGTVGSVLGGLGRDTRGSAHPSTYSDTPVDTGPSMPNVRRPSPGSSAQAGASQSSGGGSLIDLLQGKNGAGILGHIFGQQQGTVQSGVGKASGLDVGQVAKLMAMLAPIVMGALGRMNRSQGLGATGLTQVLDHDRKSIEHAMPNTAEGGLLDLLDTNRDGKVDASEAAAKLGSVLGMFKS